jgi:proline iminopeptidase
MTTRVRGLDFAVWTSPFVAGTPPLLLVNGGMIYDHALLWPALSPLAGKRQVILYDQRGRGLTEEPKDPLAATIEDDAQDIGALRRSLGIRQWDVLGHSWGGGIAMLGVAGDLAGTRRLVTVDAVGPDSGWMPELQANAIIRAPVANRETIESHFPRLGEPDPDLHGRYSRATYPAWFVDEELAAYFAPPEATSKTGAAIAAQLRKMGYNWHERLRALSVPTLVIHGERDALPVSVAHSLSGILPRASLAIVPNAGHMPFWEAPERFFELADSFLSTGRI